MRNIFLFLIFLLACSEAEGHVGLGHNHTPFHGGQVGMSGNLHIEFVAHQKGDYEIYVTDLLRKPINISNAKGTLTVNPDENNPELIALVIENSPQGFLAARGKTRHFGETIIASVEVNLQGQDPIQIEFRENLEPRTVQIEQIAQAKEYVCRQGHLFSSFQETCPLDGSSVEPVNVLKKTYPKITVI